MNIKIILNSIVSFFILIAVAHGAWLWYEYGNVPDFSQICMGIAAYGIAFCATWYAFICGMCAHPYEDTKLSEKLTHWSTHEITIIAYLIVYQYKLIAILSVLIACIIMYIQPISDITLFLSMVVSVLIIYVGICTIIGMKIASFVWG